MATLHATLNPAQAAAARAALQRNVARTRLDYQRKGSHLTAFLTVTLPNGRTFRFRRTVDLDVLLAIAVRLQKQQGREVAGFLGDLWKGVKKAGKAIVTSGVFKTAASALQTVGPVLPPPIGPAAAVAGTVMKATRALVAAKHHVAAGNPAAAQQLVNFAARTIPPKLRAGVQAQADRTYAMILRPV